MSMYELGQWGETRMDGVGGKDGQISVPQNLKFTPENFGTAPPIWTVGTTNRSANEFTNGHDSIVVLGSSAADIRQYQGNTISGPKNKPWARLATSPTTPRARRRHTRQQRPQQVDRQSVVHL